MYRMKALAERKVKTEEIRNFLQKVLCQAPRCRVSRPLAMNAP
jgi:hypothetical protein